MSYIVPRDIPKNCRECPCGWAFWDECSVLARDYEKDADSVRPDWCPLVEVPTPHGRLIDADEIIRIWDGVTFEGSIKPLIEARSTVIEAEGSEE